MRLSKTISKNYQLTMSIVFKMADKAPSAHVRRRCHAAITGNGRRAAQSDGRALSAGFARGPQRQ